MLPGNQTEPGSKMSARLEVRWVSRRGNQCRRNDNPYARDCHEPAAGLVLTGKKDELLVDRLELLSNLLELLHQIEQCLPRSPRQAAVVLITNDIDQELHPVRPLRSDNTELREMTADPVDQLGPLAHEHLANPVQHQDLLLVFLLDRNEAHRGPGHCLANGLCIRRIVLVRLHIGPDILRGQQSYLMTVAPKCPSPVVTARTGFQADLTTGQFFEERLDFVALEPATQDRLAFPVGRVNLENGLGDIQPDKGDWFSHLQSPLSQSVLSTCTNGCRLGERGHPCHHARRKLKEVFDRDGSEIAAEGLRRIAELYRIEGEIRGMGPGQRLSARQTRTAPLVTGFGEWLQSQRRRISSKSRLEEKLAYIHRQWDGLQTFLRDGRVEIDSNAVENLIRPIALTRKNALFADHDEGGRAWGRIASLIATAKINDVEPFAYLKATLEAIAAGHPASRLDELLPWNFQPSS